MPNATIVAPRFQAQATLRARAHFAHSEISGPAEAPARSPAKIGSMARIAIVLVALAVWIYAIIDCVRTDHAIIPGRLKKAHWIALTVFVPLLGSVIWLVVAFQARHPEGLGEVNFGGSAGATDTQDTLRRQAAAWGEYMRKVHSRRPSPPAAPDDDPDFLKHLEAQRRFEEWDRQRRDANERDAANAIDVTPEDHLPSDDRSGTREGGEQARDVSPEDHLHE